MISTLIMFVGLIGPVVPLAQHQELVQRLGSSDLRTRMKAVTEIEERVASDPLVLTERTVQEAVVVLLERENARVSEHTASFQKTGKDELTEVYSEYYSQVLGLANNLRKGGLLTNPGLVPRLRRALVLGVYNPDSAFAKDLAREGEPIVSLVLELTQRPDGPSKWNGYHLIGELLANQEIRTLAVPLSDSSAASLRTAARAGLVDPAPDVRRSAVTAVLRAKDRGAIPVLERLAQSDPDDRPGKYSVRSLAAEALRRLR